MAGRYIRAAGSDAAAGEELLASGVRLGSREIGVAALTNLHAFGLPALAVATGMARPVKEAVHLRTIKPLAAI